MRTQSAIPSWLPAVLIPALLTPVPALGQLTTTWETNAQNLENALIPGGVPAGITILSRATIPASGLFTNEALGTYSGFSFTNPNLALPDGIILSTGLIRRDNGDNLNDNDWLNFCRTSGGVLCGDFDRLPPAGDHPGQLYSQNPPIDFFDPAGFDLTFSVAPSAAGARLSFQVVFATEEFPEFAMDAGIAQGGAPPLAACVPDTFAAFVDGENIATIGNALINPAQGVIAFNNNVALGENYDLFSVCGFLNPLAFQQADPNNVGWPIEYDGLTNAHTFAVNDLTPDQHTIRFIVADANQGALDSAAFVSSLSFCVPPTVDEWTLENGATLSGMLASSPSHDYLIDPLSQADTTTANRRIDQITVDFSETVLNQNGTAISASAFSLSCTDTQTFDPPLSNPCPSVSSIDPSANPTVVVFFDGPIPLGEWTTLTMAVESACGAEANLDIDIASLPVDVNQDGNVGLADMSDWVIKFNGGSGGPSYLVDSNRDNQLGLADSSDLVNNFNGNASIGYYQWNGRFLPARP